jgi:hypothetical protein
MKKSRKIKKYRAIFRAAGVIPAVLIIVGGVTYAALQSQQAKLTGVSVGTASLGLLISTDGATYSTSHAGYDFGGLVPGGPALPAGGNPIYLKSTSNAAVGLKLAVTSAVNNPQDIDLSKVNVILTPTSGGAAQSISLQSLISANTSGGVAITSPAQLFPGNVVTYSLRISMDADAVSGPSATLNGLDFAFTGVAITS